MKVIKAARSVDSDPASFASRIADDISEFLDFTSRVENLDDYLDEADMDGLSNSLDALYYFAQAYATDNPESHRG